MKRDWKNEKDYAYCNDLDANGWAFEFLRRNSKYQKDWVKFCEIRDQLIKRHGSAGKENKSCYKDDLAWFYFPPKTKSQTLQDWQNKNFLSEPRRIWFEDFFAQKWDLKGAFLDSDQRPEPAPTFIKSKGYPLFPDYEDLGKYYYELDDPFSPYFQIKGKAVIIFDLENPLDPQLKKAKAVMSKRAQDEEKEDSIKRLKQKNPRKYAARLKECLRVYDAKVQGASTLDIAYHVFAEQYPNTTEEYKGSKKVGPTFKIANDYIKARYKGFL